jgi:hypothetical protein
MTTEKSERVFVAVNKHYNMYGALVRYLKAKKIDNNFTKRELMELFYQDDKVNGKLHKSNAVQSFLEMLCRFGIAAETGHESYAINGIEDMLDKHESKNKSKNPVLMAKLDEQAVVLGYVAKRISTSRELWKFDQPDLQYPMAEMPS